MDPNDQPVLPATEIAETPPEWAAPSPPTRASGFRRTVLTAGMAAALLIAGGAAVVSAASPDPSASPTPDLEHGPRRTERRRPSTTTPGQGTHVNCPRDGSGTPSATPTPAS
jgi:hypothetical protein